MENRLTPVKALRTYCLWCCNDQYKEVRLCPSRGCALWPYRMGHRPQAGTAALTPVKAIRARCLDCSNGQRKAVRLCKFTACTLYPYRLGHRPLKNETPTPENGVQNAACNQFPSECDTRHKRSNNGASVLIGATGVEV